MESAEAEESPALWVVTVILPYGLDSLDPPQRHSRHLHRLFVDPAVLWSNLVSGSLNSEQRRPWFAARKIPSTWFHCFYF